MLRLTKLLSQTPSQIIPKSIRSTYQNHYAFSRIDNYLNRLNKPLYYYLIGINLGVFLAWQMPFIDKQFMMNHFTMSSSGLFSGKLHTLVTHAFSHYNFMHLLFNMLTLFFFGRSIEAAFGSKRLLTIYFIGILGSSLMVTFENSKQPYARQVLGASGAVNAIITYFICNFPKEIIYIYFFPVPAWALGLLLLFQNSYMNNPQQGIAYDSHLGGMFAAGLYFLYTRGRGI